MRRVTIVGVVILCTACGIMPGLSARAAATDRPPLPRERPNPVPIPAAPPDTAGADEVAVPVPQARPVEGAEEPVDSEPTGAGLEGSEPAQTMPVFAEDAISPACPVLEEGRVSGRPLKPIVDEAGCVVPAVYAISAVGVERAVTLTPEAMLTCDFADRFDRFVAETVEPLAAGMLGSPLVGLAVAGSYVCRSRNNAPGARPSEHGKANAIDIAAFLLADGRRISVSHDWTLPPERAEDPLNGIGNDSEAGDGDGAIPPPVAKPVDSMVENAGDTDGEKQGDTPVEQPVENVVENDGDNSVENPEKTPVDGTGKTPEERFLRAVHEAACGPFTTVIGPDGDAHHRDHFHFDLVTRGASGTATVCQ